MAEKFIPKPKRTNMELLRMNLLKVHLAGFYSPFNKQSKYFLYTDHWHETANLNISTLHNQLTPIKEQNMKVVLSFDRHSTQLNYAVLCYCELVVRYLNWFDWVEIHFGETGHTKYVFSNSLQLITN